MKSTRSFFEELRAQQSEKNSLLCVGIDPTEEGIFKGVRRAVATIVSNRKVAAKIKRRDLERRLREWSDHIVGATAPFASVFKPNIAYFAALQAEDILRDVIFHCQMAGVPVILDAKRGDIGNTAEAYAREVFDRYNADAVTVNPYMGPDTLEPYLKHEGKGIIALCRTSNPGASTFQDLVTENGLRVYERVALEMVALNRKHGGDRISLVVGATCPSELSRIRELVGDEIQLLIPGIGAQGGDVKATVQAGQTGDGSGMMINSSRGIIYAPDPTEAARSTRNEINLHRNQPTSA